VYFNLDLQQEVVSPKKELVLCGFYIEKQIELDCLLGVPFSSGSMLMCPPLNLVTEFQGWNP
jgi:hypothetical protein